MCNKYFTIYTTKLRLHVRISIFGADPISRTVGYCWTIKTHEDLPLPGEIILNKNEHGAKYLTHMYGLSILRYATCTTALEKRLHNFLKSDKNAHFHFEQGFNPHAVQLIQVGETNPINIIAFSHGQLYVCRFAMKERCYTETQRGAVDLSVSAF